MYGPNAISREDEDKIPKFNDHAEARAWFKERYGDNFEMVTSDLSEGGKVYFYHLVLDRLKYNEMQRKLREESNFIGTELMFSYQSVEIFENGRIHIVH
ncbi:hypothetical protein BEP19_16715 [Ammoniphilus oxalaticus]|uniref:Uncharacterized protein n=1 Tax=Ammoniphilus oxalaticus TaxID=66863 RepID=A0A419SQ09_9BACL|nr:hypothetical protein [Ammoniphilus oxalaticus]RKD26480.1 hypothetical protein BEP19_16715 [Ammoniphilus oxalaticus]